MSDVVITGLGIVSPIGVGREAVWSSIEAGQSGVHAIDELAAADWIAPFGGKIKDFEGKQYVTPRKSLKVMCREIQFGYAATELAWADANLEDDQLDPERFGVVMATPGEFYCELDELKGPYEAWLKEPSFNVRRITRSMIGELFPLWMLKYLPNMAGCHVGIRHDARGPTNTIAVGDASSLTAIAEAADAIRRGHADVMLTGGTSSNLSITKMIWHRGARLALANGQPPETVCRPFDAGRRGIVYGEGAAQFVLESAEHARRRGARVLACVAGYASRYEGSAQSHLPTGDALRRAIQAAFSAAGVRAADIGHVSAHGNSTREDDPVEAAAIRDLLGDVPVTAPKSFFGNLGEASGAVELAVSIMGLSQGVIPPTLNYDVPDEACPVRVVTSPEETDSTSLLALNHSASGQAAAMVITDVAKAE